MPPSAPAASSRLRSQKRPQRRIGQEMPKGVIFISRRAADTALHRPGRTGEVRKTQALRPWLRRARRVRVEAVVALLLADPREHLPRKLVPRADLLVDRQ